MTDTTHQPSLFDEARESFSGRLLTDAQFNEAVAITDIIKSQIQRTGAFRDKLGDYAHAFARTERFTSDKAENTLRDLFKSLNGQSMNEMREDLMAREESVELDEPTLAQVKENISAIHTMIKDGDKMSFNRGYHQQADDLASKLDITNAGAKRIMVEVFREEKQMELYDWGKSLEEKYYRPQIEAEAAERKQTASSSSVSNTKARSTSQRGRSSYSRKRAPAGPTR